MPDSILTVPEVADRLRVTIKTAYRMIHRGDLPALRTGRSTRVSERVLNDLLAGRSGGGVDQ